MIEADNTIEGPVSCVVTSGIKPDKVEEYEKLISESGQDARAIDPNVTITVIKPAAATNHQYVIIMNFSSHEKLADWERSDARARLHREDRPLEEGKASFREVTGIEYWFSIPKVGALRPPARFKMAIVTVLGLYILSVIYMYTVNPWMKSLPDHVSLVVRLLVLVIAMTYLIMPLLSRLFARWLYPVSSRRIEPNAG
ncbi:MAG: hypothetical protein ACYC99_07545 [Candidatus Geothermincolia bacterium]